jgi:thiamine kinase-like enzyme
MWPLAVAALLTSWVSTYWSQHHTHQIPSVVILRGSQNIDDDNSSFSALLKNRKEHDSIGSGNWEPFLESGGYCNHLYKDSSQSKMLKVYSDLALQRMELSSKSIGELDLLMGNLGIGPRILKSSSKYMIMEELEGQVLTPEMLYARNQTNLLHNVASTLAKLHAASPPSIAPDYLIEKNNNMLWKCCQVFLKVLKEDPDLIDLYQFYSSQLDVQQNTLDHQLNLKRVIGHGDFKPSNIIVMSESSGNGIAKFVDWETCGCHYRAYDLAKVFRTPSAKKQKEQARKNCREFLQHYSHCITTVDVDDKSRGDDDPEFLWLESKLLLPMTWLEAAMFFHCKSCMEGNDAFVKLANDRLEGYEESLVEWQQDVDKYYTLLEQREQLKYR